MLANFVDSLIPGHIVVIDLLYRRLDLVPDDTANALADRLIMFQAIAHFPSNADHCCVAALLRLTLQ
jgi:hypothetical protein